MSNKFILISCGRSGSTFISSTLANIFNTEYNKIGYELFGSDICEVKKLKNPKQKMIEHFETYKNNKYIGFQWKPYNLDEKYIKVLNYVKKNNIKIILNYRNPLHVFVSKSKHRQYKIKAHYKKNETTDLQKVREIKVTLDIEKLLEYIKYQNETINTVKTLLIKNNINFVIINYEDLSNKNIVKWFDILKLINPKENIEKTKLLEILDNPIYEKTTTNTYDKIIRNYTEVKQVLIENNYADLI